MALPAKQARHLHETDVLEVAPPAPRWSPVPPEEKTEAIITRNHRDPLTAKVSEASDRIARSFGEAVGRAEVIYSDLRARGLDLSREMQRRAERMRNENPFQAIAIIGAAAFVAGLMLRIWRSQRNG